ncbi:MAG: hypothetical protein LC776_13945, partial [Acidobacteria bacterium]|nr:hypothetical protein [Acidobacteriota bacterium]
MNRRQFSTALGMGAVALGLGGIGFSAASRSPEIAITIDDFNWNKSLRLSPDERNRAILQALRSHGDLKAALFVACKNA